MQQKGKFILWVFKSQLIANYRFRRNRNNLDRLYSEIYLMITVTPQPRAIGQTDQPMVILSSEVKHAINIYVQWETQRNKTHLFDNVYCSLTLSSVWSQFIFIPIPEKNGADKFSPYRLINFMTHVLKIVFNIIQ